MAILGGVIAGSSGSLGTLFIRLTTNSTDLVRGLNQAETAVDRSAGAMGKKIAGFSLIAVGALAAVGAAAVREFAAFESSFAGVRKTIDATESEYAAMAQTFRDMAKVLPTNVNEINRVAEAAGQLGIQKTNLAEFTKVMIDMGNTTNLTSDAAATEMARFANITRMSQKDFSKLGSVIVDLGNKMATTEAEILSMGLRLAGAGKQVGMSEADILALAASLSSVGVEAEAGGTAMSQLMIKMAKASAQGSEELQFFANTASMTSEQFKQAFEENAANAILEFLKGVNSLNEAGADVFTTLESMGIQGVRLVDATTRAASAQKLFNDAIGIGREAWKENTALTIEAQKRYETLESQLKVTMNLVRDLMITIGEGMAPTIKQLNEELQGLLTTTQGGTESWKQFGEAMGTTLVVVVKTTSAIAIGLMNAFKLVAIALSDGAALVLEFEDLLTKAVTQPGVAFEKMVNKIIEGINYLIAKVPDAFWKLIGADPGVGKNFIPTFKADFAENDTPFKAWAEGFRQHADDMGAALEKQFIPQAELKRTMEEVRAEIEKTTKAELEQCEAMAKEAEEAAKVAEQKSIVAEKTKEIQQHEALMAQFKEMRSADEIRGPQTFGFGMGNSELVGAIGMRQDILNSEADLVVLEALMRDKERLTDEHQAQIEDMTAAHNDRLDRLRQAQYELAIVSAESMFGDLASITEAFAGRQSGIYKAMFAASKAFAIAEATIKIQQGIAAAASLGWPLMIPALASVVAATASIVSNIQSVKLEFGGARAMGGPVVPGKAFLVGEQGPEMFMPQGRGNIIPNDELGGGGGTRVVINNYTDAKPEVSERQDGNEKIIEVTIRRVKTELAGEVGEDRGTFNKALKDAYGLRRGGTK